MCLVQNLNNNVHLMCLPIVSKLLPHTAKDLGERSLTQTLFLKHSFIGLLKKTTLFS